MDIVFIQGLTIETVIGVYDWERHTTQKVVIDLQMEQDIRASAAEDNLAKTVDYNAVSQRLIAYTQQSSFYLLEALAEQIAQIVLGEFAVQRLKLTLHKPGAVPQATDVGIIIERSAG